LPIEIGKITISSTDQAIQSEINKKLREESPSPPRSISPNTRKSTNLRKSIVAR
jgi:hypothetical protein